MASTQSVSNNGSSSDDTDRRTTLIRDYLEGTDFSSAKDKADEITILVRDISSLELNEGGSNLEGFLWGLWAKIVDLIIGIPHGHPWQDKLVELLGAMKEVPRQVTPGMVELEGSWGSTFWHNLPIFGAEVRETWNDAPWNDAPMEERPDGLFGSRKNTPFSPTVWASLNAFTARITAASVSNFEIYAIWVLKHTLEQERKDEEVDNNLPAATMWIIYAGQIVYHNAAKDWTDSLETHAAHIRYLRRFNEPFSMERWGFWKERFEFFQHYEVLKQSTRESAGEALGRMAEIERCHPEPKASGGHALRPSEMMTAFHMQGVAGAE